MKTSVKIFYSVLLAWASVMLFSCKKEGTGGKSSVKGYAKHHSAPIPNCTIYIKYGATDFPGSNTGNYDASVKADGSGHYEISGLRKGNYYLYGVGYDAAIAAPVTGGVGIKLRYNEKLETNVPVTE